ncbi:MAG TPA: protein phosphatase 2C domain-containing protein [Pirellulales bacterium]|jgi:protein phosphatase|nr:protein phosphatase 2C domain-containing protein [Pirellulales bacterium]
MDSSAINWKQHFEHVAASDVGMRRGNNQDSFAVVIADDPAAWLARGHVFVVADGMGAHAAGELASKMAADGIPHTYYKLIDQPPPTAIVQAVQETNALIHHRGQSNQDFSGMGTTSSVLVLLPQGVLLAHAGDSRIYRVRGPVIEQLTFDHSLVWEMKAQGNLSADAVNSLVPKNIITRSLGPHESVQVDLEGPFPVAVGDMFLMCSDGLSGQVSDEEIGAFLNAMPIGEAAQSLIDLANLRGGPDNTTILIVKIVSTQLMQSPEPLQMKTSDPKLGQKKAVPFWVAGGALVLLALVFSAVAQWIAAGASALLGTILAIVGVMKNLAGGRGPMYLRAGALLGKGPHTRANAVPNASVVQAVSKVVDQLRSAANSERWPVDWTKFDALLRTAHMSSANGDFTKALRDTARAMSFMIGQLKTLKLKRPAPRALAEDEVDLA